MESTLSPPPPLFFIQVIDIPGYTLEEKVRRAEAYLIPKQMAKNGVSAEHMMLPRSTVLRVASSYTREAGVRQLERELAALCRHVALKVCVCVCVCVFIKLHITAQSGLVILVIICPSH